MRAPLVRIALAALITTFCLAACGWPWTMSQKRKQRISDCLAQCNHSQPQQQRPTNPNSGWRGL